MKAAILREFGSSLRLEDVADPTISKARDVIVKVGAVGLCATDLKIIGGTIDVKLPLILGHEVAGTIVDVGEDVDRSRIGEPVACYYYRSCGQCPWCLRGSQNLCDQSQRLGFEIPGGMAEFVVVPSENALAMPDSVTFAEGAVCMDALATPWRALRRGLRIESGENVVIVGCGGLGVNAVKIAVSMGGKVAVVEPLAGRRVDALAMGASLAVDPVNSAEVEEWSGGRIDAVLEVSGTAEGVAVAERLLGRGSRWASIGYSAGLKSSVDVSTMVLSEQMLMGSRGASWADAKEALEALGQGAISVAIGATMALKEAEEAVDRLKSRDYTGRLVLEP